jgi:site-specific DNA-methyltransferase (cytosine-N4-specific)
MGREAGAICAESHGLTTRLSRWHPYPAMVPDELAVAMAAEAVFPGSRVLDPFCGSGRLLFAASEFGGSCVGVDVNPLACLITKAKAAPASVENLSSMLAEIDSSNIGPFQESGVVPRNTSIEWFSPMVSVELAHIIDWINGLGLTRPDLLVAATALSAATRDAAWIRKSGWKLHRMPEAERLSRQPSAWASFRRRLKHYVETAGATSWAGEVSIHQGRADAMSCATLGRFDVILTSPPYGDSRTTVQYGATSSICLDVVSRLRGLEDIYLPGRDIDGACLGSKDTIYPRDDLKQFWSGAQSGDGFRRVYKFLADFSLTLRHISGLLKPHGTIAMVVGRRSVGGYRVKFDNFAVAEMISLGFVVDRIERRRLRSKSLPRSVNRFGRASELSDREKGRTKTMDEEIILTFRR